MRSLIVVGSSKIALDIAGFIAASFGTAGADYIHRGYLSLEGEEPATDPAQTRPFDPGELRPGEVVVAVGDPRLRTRLFAEHLEALRSAAINVIHPSVILAEEVRIGVGNILGPHCYLGTNVKLGDLNILNYHVGIGHHSQIGDGNFVAPGFQCGNSVEIGDGNFFGLSCTVGPGVTIRNNNRFQAGTFVAQPIASDLLCYSSERLKAVPFQET